MSQLNEELHDLLDLIKFTLSPKFIDQYSFKFSPKFLKLFQCKIFDAFNKEKPIKRETLDKHLTSKCGYSQCQVDLFYKTIEIDNYFPVISY